MTFMRICAILAAATIGLASPASAHPKLVSSSPAANATVDKPTSILLSFSEKLVAPMSGASLTMTGMPGMANHAPMKIGVKTAVAKDGKTMVVSMSRPLSSGSYALKWHIVGADAHRIEGGFAFKVK